MGRPTFHGLSTTSNECTDPSTSSSNHELNPDFIAMVRSHTFSGAIHEEPYDHLQEFEDMFSFLAILGMTSVTLRWKLFHFSLIRIAKQWYIRSVGSMSGDWEKLRVNFCSSFSLPKHINSLPMDILDFEQLEKKSLGAAWARFLLLLAIYPHLSIPEGVSLYIFLSCLGMKSAREFDIIAGGSFEDKTTKEGREILDTLSEDSFLPTNHNEPLRDEYVSSHESLSIAKPEPTVSTSQFSSIEPSPKPGTMEDEEIQPPEFLYRFEDDPFENLTNTSRVLVARL
jgi:hypothetical protein